MTENQLYCIKTLADWAGGEHHLQEVKLFGDEVALNHFGDVATVDFDGMTRLVLLAHRDAVRIQVSYSGPRMIRIAAHRRKHGMPRADYSATVFGEGPWMGMTWDEWHEQRGGQDIDPYTGTAR